ncbi:MAG: NADPH:quinone oxidoreductase family protein [Myxococcota bacterium]
MRAAVARTYGAPETLRIEALPDPTPGPGEVRVRVRAAAVNFPDLLVLANSYQVSAPLPFTPGSELAGEVTACAPGVETLAPGDRVYGALLVGAFAEAAVLPERALSRIPDGVDFAAAAAFGVAYTTAWGALASAAALQPGETVLVLGAAGGVGLAAIEVARALGAEVVAAASSEAKRAVCFEKGAAHAIDAAPHSLRDAVRSVAAKGVDVVIDPVGGAATEPALRSLAHGGRHVVVGFAAGEIPRIPTNRLLLRNARLVGFELGGWQRHHPEVAKAGRATLEGWLAEGRIAPHVGARYPLARCAEALRLVAERRAVGKVLIEP